ncbi:MAG: NAD(P)/FAD-dependent oxidoreductase [Collinsella intestinalis]
MAQIETRDYDVVVIGGGPAGMGAALAAHEAGASTVVIERNEHLGGILRQCIHPGFGLTHFKEELTGPEYAQRFINRVREAGIDVMIGSMALGIDEGGREDAAHSVTVMGEDGMVRLTCRSVVLAMGCRERTRFEIKIPGSRPAGVYTAGLAQRYINIENLRPGHRVVILGSGDIGLIMARRCALEGLEVEGVYELMPYANGLHRNVKNCLSWGLLHLSTTVRRARPRRGRRGLERGRTSPITGTERIIPCDTLLLSVGLIPENECLSRRGRDRPANTRTWIRTCKNQ